MADTPTDAFLSGQGIPVALPRIEAELAQLWGPAAEQVGGPQIENPNVTRLVLANLVVVADCLNPRGLISTLDEVVARFPSRAIVLGLNDSPDRAVSAEVAALCHLPAPGLPQVCSERIVLRAGPNALDLLPGAVRPLLEADLPFVLWWTCDPGPSAKLFRDLADEATRIIVDLPDPATPAESLKLALDPEINAYSRDSAWFGIALWRELIAQFFDTSSCRYDLNAIRSVTIDVIAPKAGPTPRIAAWLGAWLAGQLGWAGRDKAQTDQSRLDATFTTPKGEAKVAIVTKIASTIQEVRLSAVTIELDCEEGPVSLRLARLEDGSNDLRVEICSDHSCALPRVVVAPHLNSARRIAGALESARLDIPYRRAVPHALWLIS